MKTLEEQCEECPRYADESYRCSRTGVECQAMNNIAIRKVKALEGMAKEIAEKYELAPNDLVIVTVSLEKVIGSPVEYLLKQIETGDITEDDIQRFGELFVENVNKELGIEKEYRHSTGSAKIE